MNKLLKIIRLEGNSVYNISDIEDVRLLTKMHLRFFVLNEHKFKHNFDSLTPFWACGNDMDLLLLLSSISGLQCMHCSPHAMLQIVLESSFHLSLSSAIFRNMIKSSVVLNCFTSRSCLLFASTMS